MRMISHPYEFETVLDKKGRIHIILSFKSRYEAAVAFADLNDTLKEHSGVNLRLSGARHHEPVPGFWQRVMSMSKRGG